MSDGSDEQRQREVDALMDDAYAALDEERFDDALALARQMQDRRFSGGFEIEARARWGRGEHDLAIKALEDGVAKAPGASPLWHWLGTFRSDNGDYAGALVAFEREAEFAHVPASISTYNIAVVYERMERYDEALAVIDRLERPDDRGPTAGDFAELRARLLLASGRPVDAIVRANEAIERLKDLLRDTDADGFVARRATLARAHGFRGAARLELGDRDDAIEDVEMAMIHADVAGLEIPDTVYDVIRRIADRPSPDAQLFRLLLEGRFDEDNGGRGFVVPVEVIADDSAEGLIYARRFVPRGSRDGLQISEAQAVRAMPGALRGVVWRGPFHTWQGE